MTEGLYWRTYMGNSIDFSASLTAGKVACASHFVWSHQNRRGRMVPEFPGISAHRGEKLSIWTWFGVLYHPGINLLWINADFSEIEHGLSVRLLLQPYYIPLHRPTSPFQDWFSLCRLTWTAIVPCYLHYTITIHADLIVLSLVPFSLGLAHQCLSPHCSLHSCIVSSPLDLFSLSLTRPDPLLNDHLYHSSTPYFILPPLTPYPYILHSDLCLWHILIDILCYILFLTTHWLWPSCSYISSWSWPPCTPSIVAPLEWPHYCSVILGYS